MATDGVVFSIARLAPPSLELGLPDRLHLQQDMVADSAALTLRSAMPASGGVAAGFASRVQADGSAHPQGGTGGGLLKLPQAFGSIYLGQVRWK